METLIMAKQVLLNLFRRPATERYPFVAKTYFPGTRGLIKIDIAKCIFCGICQRKCPTAAIVVTKEPKTWEIDRLRCIFCGYCVEVCPKKCLSQDTHHSPASQRAQKDLFTYA